MHRILVLLNVLLKRKKQILLKEEKTIKLISVKIFKFISILFEVFFCFRFNFKLKKNEEKMDQSAYKQAAKRELFSVMKSF